MKKIITACWLCGALLLIGSIIYVNASKNFFTAQQSGLIIFISTVFFSAAMLLKTLKNRDKNETKAIFAYKLLAVAAFFIYCLILFIKKTA